MCFVPHRICCYMQQGYTITLKAITKANVEYLLHTHTLHTRCEIVVFWKWKKPIVQGCVYGKYELINQHKWLYPIDDIVGGRTDIQKNTLSQSAV